MLISETLTGGGSKYKTVGDVVGRTACHEISGEIIPGFMMSIWSVTLTRDQSQVSRDASIPVYMLYSPSSSLGTSRDNLKYPESAVLNIPLCF